MLAIYKRELKSCFQSMTGLPFFRKFKTTLFHHCHLFIQVILVYKIFL